ncbi:MAG TPA: glycoside hydrolase family 5 protein [Polyangia bacterium]|nr:glycoside hydrolase family 5 protein [Polyangia bacterium]
MTRHASRGSLGLWLVLSALGCATGSTPSAQPDGGGTGGVASTGGAGGDTGTGGTTTATPTGGTGGTATGGVTGTGGTTTSSTGGTGGATTATGGTGGALATGAPAGSPVALHGALHVQGAHVVDEHGQPTQLKGMSLYWSNYPAGAAFFNADVIEWLAKDWKISVIRIAVGVTGMNDGDYLQKPDVNLALLDAVAQAAFANGIYAIVDWHDHHAPMHLDAAKSFFDMASKKYGGHANTIYEIWNEPRGGEGLTWTGDLKPYADTIAKVIRANDAKNLIIAGTPNWDQQPTSVIGHPVDDTNVAYTLHFYAGYQPHFFGGDLGKNAQMAVAGGIPLFVTEWGAVDPITQTMFNADESNKWMAFLDQNSISSCNWAISGANEGSSALKQGASPKGGWAATDLSQSGAFVRGLIRGN